MVRPVKNAALSVPLVFSAHTNSIPCRQRHPARQIDVVRNQESLIRAAPDDEALMTRAPIVVRQHCFDDTLDHDHNTGTATLEEFEGLEIPRNVHRSGGAPFALPASANDHDYGE
jgi:hypothetical protein